MQMNGATGYFVTPSGYGAARWSDLFNQVMNNIATGNTSSANTDGGSSKYDYQYIAINGKSTWIQPIWTGSGGEQAEVLDSLNIANPDGKPGWNAVLLPGPNDTVLRYDYPQNTSLSELYMMVAIAVTMGAASIAAAGAGVVSSSAATLSTSEAAFDTWAATQGAAEAGVSLTEFGGSVASWEGALTTAATLDPAYANEWSKLLQQQTLADSGVNILSTSLPTVSLSDASSLSSMLSPSNIKNAISTIKTAAGALTAAKGIISGSGSSTQLPITAGRQTTFLPAGGVVAPSAGGSNSSALLLAAASIIGFALIGG